MTEKTKDNLWIPTCNRFVAFMDIMCCQSAKWDTF